MGQRRMVKGRREGENPGENPHKDLERDIQTTRLRQDIDQSCVDTSHQHCVLPILFNLFSPLLYNINPPPPTPKGRSQCVRHVLYKISRA